MKLKSIIIKNYKSFGEENNVLILDELNTVIGKNESGKSNLIECLSGICLSGIKDSSFFDRFNKNTGNYPTISVVLTPTSKEEQEYNIKGETTITLNKQYDIDIEGSFSDMIKNNKNFQENREQVNNLNKNISRLFNNQDQKNNYSNIIKMINNAETKIFINHKYIRPIIERINNNTNYEDISKYLKNCISYLNEIKRLLPNFIEINDYSLKSKYTTKYLKDNNENKTMLKHLLNCMDMSLDDLMKYWSISNEADKLNFSESFNDKLKEIIDKFNKFYVQEKVVMCANFENDSLNFAVKTTKKYVNFEERSNGLKWYLNMYFQIISKTSSSDIENYIILIDEPGVYLHVNAQKEVLKLFEDFITKDNQIIYTTHSPFMIYEDKLYRTRIIIKDDNGNSNIGNKYYSLPHKMGSKTETLTPLLMAIGMNMNYNILSINNEKENIITEGISDCNYIKGYLLQKGKIDKYNIIPSVSVENINNIASIFIGWGCNFKIILDQDNAGRRQHKKLTEKLTVNPSHIVFTDGKKDANIKNNLTIEDIFSDNDKNKIGIVNDDYSNEKAYYSLEILKKVENNEFKYDKDTMENFDNIFQQLFEKYLDKII